MVRPDAPQFTLAHAELWSDAGKRRYALLVTTWLVALVTALIASDFSSVVYVAVVATPLLLMRPVLAASVAFVAGVTLAVVPEPTVVRVMFGLHAFVGLAVLIGLWRKARAQRAVVASVARPVSVDLPDGLMNTSRKRVRSFVVLGFVVIGLVAGVFVADVVWWVLVGCFALFHLPREIAVRVLPERLLTRPRLAVAMLVRAEPDGRALLMTGDCPVASFPVGEVLHPPGLEDPLIPALEEWVTPAEDAPAESEPVPATVIGDFRIGGWVAVVTDNCVLLPRGPLRANWEPPELIVPPSLVDGRRWSGLQSN